MSAGDALSPRQFFHGTNADLQPGDHIVPASERGESVTPYRGSHTEKADWVYITHNKRAARDYADVASAEGKLGRSRVYTVEPVGDEIEPDKSEPRSFRVRRAKVTGEIPHGRIR